MESCLHPSKEGQTLVANIIILTNNVYRKLIIDTAEKCADTVVSALLTVFCLLPIILK